MDANGNVRSSFLGHGVGVNDVAFSADGARVVSASDDATLRIWEILGDGKASHILKGHRGAVTAAAFSPDGTRVVSGSADGTVRIWNAHSGGQLRVLEGHRGEITDVAFNSQGTRIVSCSKDRTFRIWDTESNGQARIFVGHGEAVTSAAFSPDGQRVVSASEDGTIRLWSVFDDGAREALMAGHSEAVRSVAFSNDGQLIVSASDDGTVRVWPSRRSSEPRVVVGHLSSRLADLAFEPNDGRRLVGTTGDDRRVLFWQTDGDRAHDTLADSGRVLRVWLAADQLLTVAADGTVQRWRAGAPVPARACEPVAGRPWGTAAFRLDGETLVAASELPRRRDLGDVGTPVIVRICFPRESRLPLTLPGSREAVLDLAYSPDGQLIAGALADGTIRLWCSMDGEIVDRLEGHQAAVQSVAFHPGGKLLVSASEDGTARVWWTDSGASIILEGHSGPVRAAVFSPDGQRIATASDDGQIRIWRADGTGESLVLGESGPPVTAIAFSPDASHLASASHELRLWRISWALLVDHLRSSTQICLSPEERVTYLLESMEKAWRHQEECELNNRQLLRSANQATTPP